MFVLCRVAFAASCCEQMLPNYLRFSRLENWGDSTLLRSALDEVWISLETGVFNIGRIRELIEQCDRVIPDTEDFDSPFTSAALDAGTSVIATLECCLDGEPDHAVDVASFAYDTVDMFLRVQCTSESMKQDDMIVLNNPLMITLLQRLSEDAQVLLNTSVFDPDFVRRFRRDIVERSPILGNLPT